MFRCQSRFNNEVVNHCANSYLNLMHKCMLGQIQHLVFCLKMPTKRSNEVKYLLKRNKNLKNMHISIPKMHMTYGAYDLLCMHFSMLIFWTHWRTTLKKKTHISTKKMPHIYAQKCGHKIQNTIIQDFASSSNNSEHHTNKS